MSGENKDEKKETLGENPGEKKNNPTPKKKEEESLYGDSLCTVGQLHSSLGLNPRLKLWLNKKYNGKEKRTLNEWCDELLKEGAIEKKPEILSRVVTVSK